MYTQHQSPINTKHDMLNAHDIWTDHNKYDLSKYLTVFALLDLPAVKLEAQNYYKSI